MPTALVFGRFRVLLHRRELLADNRPVELGARAFDGYRLDTTPA
jgi:hypothetical protein